MLEKTLSTSILEEIYSFIARYLKPLDQHLITNVRTYIYNQTKGAVDNCCTFLIIQSIYIDKI